MDGLGIVEDLENPYRLLTYHLHKMSGYIEQSHLILADTIKFRCDLINRTVQIQKLSKKINSHIKTLQKYQTNSTNNNLKLSHLKLRQKEFKQQQLHLESEISELNELIEAYQSKARESLKQYQHLKKSCSFACSADLLHSSKSLFNKTNLS